MLGQSIRVASAIGKRSPRQVFLPNSAIWWFSLRMISGFSAAQDSRPRDRALSAPSIVAHVCGDPLSRYTCRATRVALHVSQQISSESWGFSGRKVFQPVFGAYRGLARVLKSPSNRQNCRKKEEILEKGTFIFCAKLWYAPNPGSKEI